MTYHEKHKNDVASGKSGFLHYKISKYTKISSKKKANCETPFPVFTQILSKTAISVLIRLIFEAD